MKKPASIGAKNPERRKRNCALAKSEKTVSPQDDTGRRKGHTGKSSSRWLRTVLLAAYVLAIIWTSRSSAAEFRVIGTHIPASISFLKPASGRHARLAVQAYVQNAARSEGVNPRVAEWIVSHESRHRPDAIGDGGESRGLWQINKTWHPEVSDQCAYDVSCSTHWSLERIHAGYVHEWSTWKYCREKFGDCPF